MDGYELYQLGRKLMKLGEQAMPEMGLHRLSAATRAVLFEVSENPDSSISDLTARLGLPQSQISACVARLRDSNAVTTTSDPQDRRRTLVRISDEALKRAESRPPAPIDAVVARAIASGDAARIARVNAALDAVAELLEREE